MNDFPGESLERRSQLIGRYVIYAIIIAVIIFVPWWIKLSSGNYVIYAIGMAMLFFVGWIRIRSVNNTLGALATVLEPSSTETRGGFDWRFRGRDGGPVIGRYGGRSVIGRYGGRSVILGSDVVGRTDKRFYVLLGLRSSRSSISYRARLEDAEDRIAKKLHFSRDIKTGVTELDSRYVFSSSEPDRFTPWVVGSNAVRAAFKALLEDRGVDILSQEEGWLIATMYGYSDDRTVPDNVRGVLDAMSELAQSGERI